MIFGDRRVDSLDLRNDGTVVSTSGGDQKLRLVRGRVGSYAPAAFALTRANDGSIQTNERREFKALDPGLNIAQNAWLILAGQRQVAQRPVLFAELDVLPGRQVAPKPADALAALQ
jgi:hypothetical protein